MTKLRKWISDFINFLRLLRGMPPTRTGVSRAGAKQAREAMHVRGAGGGTSSADSHLGKAIAGGHQEKVYGDPRSRNRVVGYGGRAPRHQAAPSGFLTAILVLLFMSLLTSALLLNSALWRWL